MMVAYLQGSVRNRVPICSAAREFLPPAKRIKRIHRLDIAAVDDKDAVDWPTYNDSGKAGGVKETATLR